MKRDFDTFGNMVVFVTTINTKKLRILLAAFVRINHNSKNVIFGVLFVLKEDNDSMVWLFNTFKRYMENKYMESSTTY